jgi:Transcriptional activator TraM
MHDPLEALIKEIAAKHGIAVSRDDPILVLQTINNRLMQDSAKAQKDQLGAYKEELEGIALRWENASKIKAERILNAALTASKAAMDEGAKAASKSAREEIDAALAAMAGPLQEARRIGLLNVVASCITLAAAAAVALWATLH